ncbi:MAG TPA: RidA family protein [Coxiellaceae bacterium]|nr:RidA family protein [Coxiellaceae bacterium]
MKIIHTSHAPEAIGTYSQAVCAGNLVYISGQIPLDPKTMTLISGDFAAQATQAFDNLKAVATAAGATLANVVKLQIYLRDMNKFSIVNEVMSSYFKKPYPARAVVEVSRLPKDALIEVDAVLYLGD